MLERLLAIFFSSTCIRLCSCINSYVCSWKKKWRQRIKKWSRKKTSPNTRRDWNNLSNLVFLAIKGSPRKNPKPNTLFLLCCFSCKYDVVWFHSVCSFTAWDFNSIVLKCCWMSFVSVTLLLYERSMYLANQNPSLKNLEKLEKEILAKKLYCT